MWLLGRLVVQKSSSPQFDSTRNGGRSSAESRIFNVIESEPTFHQSRSNEPGPYSYQLADFSTVSCGLIDLAPPFVWGM